LRERPFSRPSIGLTPTPAAVEWGRTFLGGFIMFLLAWVPGPFEVLMICGCCGFFMLAAAGVGVAVYLSMKKSRRNGPPPPPPENP
jgi:hypothetical protein